MAKGESRLLSGRIKTKSGNTLDSKRSTFLSLDNAEPNFGNPDSDRYILASLTNGGRLFLKLNKGFLVSADSVSGDESTFEINPSGLSNAAGTTLADVLDNLDSAITGATNLALTLALTNPTITDSNFNGSGIVSDPLTLDSDLRIFGITGDSATFTNITSAGTVDFSGTTTVNNLTSGNVNIDGGFIDGTAIGHTTPDSASFTTISTSGAATLASASVTDLTDNRVVIAGTAGELEDDANLTYDGTSLNVANTTASTNSANGALVVAGGVGIGGALNVGGNLEILGDFTVTGTTTTIEVETLAIQDPLIHLADSNESSDEVDIGFVGHYFDAALGGRQHTGIFRDASNDEYYLFAQYQDSALDSSPRSNVIDRTRPSFVLAPFNAMSVTAETLSGTVSADSITTTNLTATSVDINGGFIDGTAIGHTTPDSGTFTNLARTSPAGVTAGSYGSTTTVPVVTVDASGFINAITTATISNTIQIGETVITVGDEVDNLVLDSATITKLNVTGNATLASVDINGGTIDGTTIGHTTPDSATFTNLTVSGTINTLQVNNGNGNDAESTAVGVDALVSANSGTLRNTAFGHTALQDNTSGERNTAIGQGALSNATTGSYNTAIGQATMNTGIVTGSSNAAVGADAFQNVTSGSNSVAVGRLSLNANTTGTSNTAIGKSALSNNTTGSNNVALGSTALALSSTGATSNNVAIGNAALDGLNPGQNANTVIGASAGRDLDSGTENIIIGFAAEASATNVSNEITLGDETGSKSLRIPGSSFYINGGSEGTGGSRVGINTNAPTAQLEVTGNAVISGTINDLDIGHGGGNVATNTIVGRLALDDNTSGLENTAVGRSALENNTIGIRNTAIGYRALRTNDSGDNNIAVGYSSMLNTTGSNNIGLGTQSLYASTGVDNIALGTSTLKSANPGSYNTAIGNQAMTTASDGSFNIAIGRTVLRVNSGNNNVGLGEDALRSNTSGGNNIAIGLDAVRTTTIGHDNIGIGRTALNLLNSGDDNVAIGGDAGDNLTTGSVNTLIGYGSQASTATVSNEITLGDGTDKSFRIPGSQFYINGGSEGTTGSNVGIGTNAPTGKVEIEEDGAVNDRLLYLNSAGGLSGGQSGPFYGLYADIKSNNDATEAYGAYIKAEGGTSDDTYGIWAQATQGSSTVDAIGVLGKTIVNSGSTNHGSERALGTGPAAGVYALAETTGTGTASQTTALHASNASTHGSLAYGVYIETISGPTTVVPLKVDHDGSEIFKLDSAGNATISGTVNLVKFEGDSATVASAATAVIATAATSSFNAIEATIVSENATNGNRQISKVLLTHDTTDTYMNEYAVITTTDSDQFTMDADISGSDFRLKLENVSGNTLYAKTSITYL